MKEDVSCVVNKAILLLQSVGKLFRMSEWLSVSTAAGKMSNVKGGYWRR